MTRLLDVPWVVNEEAERISTHGGLATIDFCGTERERREAMRIVAQAQEMARILMADAESGCAVYSMTTCEGAGVMKTQCNPCRARAVLRAAGVEVA